MEPNRMEQQVPPRPNPPPPFGRCLKNQAASAGFYALDGCREFTPTDLDSLLCQACGCHRNFHYREGDQSQSPVVERVDLIDCPYHHHHPPPPTSRLIAMPNSSGTLADSPPAAPISSSYYSAPPPPHMFFALSPSFPAAPELANNVNRQSTLNTGSNAGTRKKRFRTKFSQDQKAQMQEFAERIGWKMPKREEEMIVGFCTQIGVEKGVFKVWMHNHKNSSIRDNHHQNHREDGSNAKGANGSSSSS